MTHCVVCERDGPRFHCRFCRAAYCCAVCNKAHRDPTRPDCCSGVVNNDNDNNNNKSSGEECGEKTAELQASSTGSETRLKRERETDVNFIDGERDEDGELVVLGEAHLSELAHDPNIRNKLRSSELQRLLRVIDSSRSRIDALEAAMANTPEFKQFCDDVLGVVAIAERRLRPWMR